MSLENLYFVRDELERNYACVQGGGYEDRKQNIVAMPSPILRAGEVALLGFASKYPEATDKILGNKIEDTGYQYAGGGSENTTITDGVSVIKIFRKSVHWSEQDREETAKKLSNEHSILCDYLGKFIAGQETSSSKHPLRNKKRAILTTQQYYEFDPTEIFNPYDPGIDGHKIYELEDRYPGIRGDLAEFAEAGLRLYSEKKLLIDTSGLNNVVVARIYDQLELVCLDGTPIQSDKESDRNRLLGQLKALSQTV